MKQIIKSFINTLILSFSKTTIGLFLYQVIVNTAMIRNKDVIYSSLKMSFIIPNRLSSYRVNTFATKEPETLEWIKTIPNGSVMWDIGANIGLYSIYAAKARNCRVYAFEPSVFNLEMLARNIFLNNLQQQITIVPIALSDILSESLFQMSSTEWGGALSTFSAGYDQNGKPMSDVFEYKTIGLSMNAVLQILKIPAPKYIKMDVDGIEHLILKGGVDVLSMAESVLIEINEDFSEQFEESHKYLMNAGLSLFKKCQIDSNNQYNQWWIRSNSNLQ